MPDLEGFINCTFGLTVISGVIENHKGYGFCWLKQTFPWPFYCQGRDKKKSLNLTDRSICLSELDTVFLFFC